MVLKNILNVKLKIECNAMFLNYEKQAKKILPATSKPSEILKEIKSYMNIYKKRPDSITVDTLLKKLSANGINTNIFNSVLRRIGLYYPQFRKVAEIIYCVT